MPIIKVMLHLVWSTKNRFPFLRDEIRPAVFDHILQNGREKGIYIDCVNGYTDHAHCLVSLSCDQTISKILQLIKGESSHWINEQKFCREKFEWQDEYFAESVSPADLKRVRAYIHGQEEHHKKVTFQDEVRELMKNYETSVALG